jgi:hypothetical protein
VGRYSQLRGGLGLGRGRILAAQRLANLALDAGWLGWGDGDDVTEQVAAIQQHCGNM